MYTYYITYILFSGAVYRLRGSTPCNQNEMKSDEVDVLTDGDLSSCESDNGNTGDWFGLFLDKIPRTRILLSVIGNINCRPISGLLVTIVSLSEQSNICKTVFSSSSDMCHYRCYCMQNDICSHILVKITTGDRGEICEIKFGWYILHKDKFRSSSHFRNLFFNTVFNFLILVYMYSCI